MKKKAIIYDLDNTLYPVSAIGEKLFGPLFDLILQSGNHNHEMDAIKKAIMKTPYRIVAQRHNFSEVLTNSGIALQENLVYDEAIATFEDYAAIKTIPAERFLVTTGFEKMQLSKIRQMGIDADFKEIHVVNPTKSSKKEVFADIMHRYNYAATEMLVVGDDPESEIKAAKELGIETVLYDKAGEQDRNAADYAINDFNELPKILGI